MEHTRRPTHPTAMADAVPNIEPAVSRSSSLSTSPSTMAATMVKQAKSVSDITEHGRSAFGLHSALDVAACNATSDERGGPGSEVAFDTHTARVPEQESRERAKRARRGTGRAGTRHGTALRPADATIRYLAVTGAGTRTNLGKPQLFRGKKKIHSGGVDCNLS